MLLPYLTALAGVVVAAALIIGFGNDRRNLDTASSCVDGYERQICRTHMPAIIEDVVFHPGLYSHFHRAVKHAIDRGAKNHQVANVHRDPEIHVINRGGDYVVAGMAMRGHGSGEIDPMHQAP